MNEVIEAKALDNFVVKLIFADGEVKKVNLRPFIGRGFTSELLHPEKFNKLFLEPGGGIAWENGYDFCPNFLKDLEDVRLHA